MDKLMEIVEGYMEAVKDTPLEHSRQRLLMLRISFNLQRMVSELVERREYVDL